MQLEGDSAQNPAVLQLGEGRVLLAYRGRHDEVLTLASDANDSDELSLTSGASYLHEAIDAWQGEVGLLSRMIVIQGAADDSEPSDASPLACTHDYWMLGSQSVPCPNPLTGFGAHVIAVGD